MRTLLTLCIVLLFAVAVEAQCRTGNCSVRGTPTLAAPPPPGLKTTVLPLEIRVEAIILPRVAKVIAVVPRVVKPVWPPRYRRPLIRRWRRFR